MNTVWQRPLLVGGIGLTLGLWGLDSVSHSLPGMGDLVTLGAIAAGGSYWWYGRRSSQTSGLIGAVDIDRATLDRSLQQVELVINQLAIESPNSPQIDELRQALAQVQINSTRLDRQIVITGGQRVGKSSLLNLLTTAPVPSAAPLKYIKTPALFSSGVASDAAQLQARKLASNADLVLFLTNGDLTATEYKYINDLHQANQRVVLLLNQVDRYLPEERNLILQQLPSACILRTLSGAGAVLVVTTSAAVSVPVSVDCSC